MSVSVIVSYDTNSPSGAVSSYRVHRFDESGEPVTGALSQHGATYNGLASYHGTFDSVDEAARAVLEFATVPGLCLVRLSDGSVRLRAFKGRHEQGCVVLGTRYGGAVSVEK